MAQSAISIGIELFVVCLCVHALLVNVVIGFVALNKLFDLFFCQFKAYYHHDPSAFQCIW